MFREPLLAHPAEIGGLHAAWHPHPRDDADRDRHDGDGEDEQHMILAALRSASNDPDTRHGWLSVRLSTRPRARALWVVLRRLLEAGKLTCQRCGTARDCPRFFALSAAPQGPDRDDLGDCVDACAVTERARRWPGD